MVLDARVDADDDIVTMDDLLDALQIAERLNARIAAAVGRLDAQGAWGIDGHVSMAAWLRDRARMSDADASRLVHTGRFVHGYPVVEIAYTSGSWSAAQVQAFRAVVTPRRAPVFEVMAAGVVEAVKDLDARSTQLVARQWVEKADAIVGTDEPREREREVHWSCLDDGTMVGRFVLDSANAALFITAIDTARTWDGSDDQRGRRMANADALAGVVSFYNARHDQPGTPRHRPHVELTQQFGDVTATTSSGHVLSADDTAWLTCDCVLHRVLKAGSAVLDYGRTTRFVPANLFRAVVQRDGGCRFPGCNRPVAWCDAHHIRHWRHGGHTSLPNLVLLCAHHHRVVHRQHLDLRLEPDATVHVISPGMRTLTSRPHGPPTTRAA